MSKSKDLEVDFFYPPTDERKYLNAVHSCQVSFDL